jgi:hypothetical protein
MKHPTVTRSQVTAVRESARGDQSLIDACNVVLWGIDANGELHGHYTASGDHVRAAITARIDAGEMPK